MNRRNVGQLLRLIQTRACLSQDESGVDIEKLAEISKKRNLSEASEMKRDFIQKEKEKEWLRNQTREVLLNRFEELSRRHGGFKVPIKEKDVDTETIKDLIKSIEDGGVERVAVNKKAKKLKRWNLISRTYFEL
jgi:hypothetical protein